MLVVQLRIEKVPGVNRILLYFHYLRARIKEDDFILKLKTFFGANILTHRIPFLILRVHHLYLDME